jgi:HK97 family phage portal protein
MARRYPVGVYDHAVRWRWGRREQAVSNTAAIAVNDPRFAGFLNPFTFRDVGDVTVTEDGALSLSAIYRAVSLVSGTLASLPFRSYRGVDDAMRERVGSIFDDPDPNGQTSFEWKESAFVHLLLHGRCGALKFRAPSGAIQALPLVHPSMWTVVRPTSDEYAHPETLPAGGLWFDVSMPDGTRRRFDSEDFWYVPGMSLFGQESVGLIEYARLTLATASAGDRAAGNVMTNGALVSGIATPDDDVDITDDVPEIRRQLNSALGGAENAGQVAVINRRLKLQPWSMTNSDAQFLQLRQFQIEEISRFTGVPPHLLMQTDKQTSWGTGVEEQNRAMGRTVLAPWANRFEGRASRLLANPRWAEFDFTGLERPSPDREIELLLKQVDTLITLNEARKVRNLEPLPGGDTLRSAAPAAAPDPEGGDGNVDPAAE